MNHNFDSWNELKTYLKQTYSEKKHQSHLLLDLQNCKQNYNENVSQFLCKIEGCLKRLLSSIQQTNIKEAELNGRLAAMKELALHTFILSVKPEIGCMLRARKLDNLIEAFSIA